MTEWQKLKAEEDLGQPYEALLPEEGQDLACDSMWQLYDKLKINFASFPIAKKESSLPSDIKFYFSETPIERKENPLLYWQAKKEALYERAINIAKIWLPSERLISRMNNFRSNSRSTMSNSHLHKLLV